MCVESYKQKGTTMKKVLFAFIAVLALCGTAEARSRYSGNHVVEDQDPIASLLGGDDWAVSPQPRFKNKRQSRNYQDTQEENWGFGSASTSLVAYGHQLQRQGFRVSEHPSLGIEPLVPLHRRADVLDLVEPVEVTTRHSRVGVAEARRNDERVVGNGFSIEHLNGLLRSVDRRDGRVVADVDAGINIRLLVCEEQRLEAGDFLAVHEGYPARAVGNVLKLSEDDDLCARVDGLRATCGSEAATTSADHNNALTHGKLQSEMAGKRTQ